MDMNVKVTHAANAILTQSIQIPNPEAEANIICQTELCTFCKLSNSLVNCNCKPLARIVD